MKNLYLQLYTEKSYTSHFLTNDCKFHKGKMANIFSIRLGHSNLCEFLWLVPYKQRTLILFNNGIPGIQR